MLRLLNQSKVSLAKQAISPQAGKELLKVMERTHSEHSFCESNS